MDGAGGIPPWAVVAVLAAAVSIILVAALRAVRLRHPYRRAGPLFTPAEQNFLGYLERAVAGRARIYGKVRLADLVVVRDGIGGRRYWRAFTAVACKHVDYVLCALDSHEVIVAIELDDRSHGRAERQARDRFVDGVMRTAGIPLLRFPARSRYAVEELRRALASAGLS